MASLQVCMSTSGMGCLCMGWADMDSNPAPIPTSICPAVMALAMLATACRPELHCRLVVDRGVVYKIPEEI